MLSLPSALVLVVGDLSPALAGVGIHVFIFVAAVVLAVPAVIIAVDYGGVMAIVASSGVGDVRRLV